MTKGEKWLMSNFSKEYLVYFRGKWCGAAGKAPLSRYVDGCQTDPDTFGEEISFK